MENRDVMLPLGTSFVLFPAICTEDDHGLRDDSAAIVFTDTALMRNKLQGDEMRLLHKLPAGRHRASHSEPWC